MLTAIKHYLISNVKSNLPFLCTRCKKSRTFLKRYISIYFPLGIWIAFCKQYYLLNISVYESIYFTIIIYSFFIFIISLRYMLFPENSGNEDKKNDNNVTSKIYTHILLMLCLSSLICAAYISTKILAYFLFTYFYDKFYYYFFVLIVFISYISSPYITNCIYLIMYSYTSMNLLYFYGIDNYLNIQSQLDNFTSLDYNYVKCSLLFIFANSMFTYLKSNTPESKIIIPFNQIIECLFSYLVPIVTVFIIMNINLCVKNTYNFIISTYIPLYIGIIILCFITLCVHFILQKSSKVFSQLLGMILISLALTITLPAFKEHMGSTRTTDFIDPQFFIKKGREKEATGNGDKGLSYFERAAWAGDPEGLYKAGIYTLERYNVHEKAVQTSMERLYFAYLFGELDALRFLRAFVTSKNISDLKYIVSNDIHRNIEISDEKFLSICRRYAMYFVGRICAFDVGIIGWHGMRDEERTKKQFRDKGRELFQRAGIDSIPEARSASAFLKIFEGDSQKGLAELEEYAAQRNKQALVHLAYLYRYGKIVRRDDDRARFYLEEAVHLGYEPARFLLATIYLDSPDVALRQKGESILYTLEHQHHLGARLELAQRQLSGIGLPQNIQNAQKLLISLSTLTGEQIFDEKKKLPSDALTYSSLLYRRESVRATCILGRMYYEGKYVEKDFRMSLYYLQKPSQKGDIESENIIAAIKEEQLYFRPQR